MNEAMEISPSLSLCIVVSYFVAGVKLFDEPPERRPPTEYTPSKSASAAVEKTTTGSTSDRLWEQTIIMLNSNDKWRNPELSLTSLAEQLESNRTYVGYRQRSTAYRNIPNRIHREHQALSPSTLPSITPYLHDKMGIFVSIPHHAPKVQRPVLQKSIVVF